MNLSEKLKLAFEQFLSGKVSNDYLREITACVDEREVDTLVKAVDSLKDPSEYCENDFDDKTVAGFFLYIDFITAIIINLGEPAISLVAKYASSSHPFVPWIVKYSGDNRFHGDILAKFSGIFEED